MAQDRLNGSDKRILILWIVCGIAGALFAHKYFFRAFPEAAVDFKISRAAAQERAKSFVESLGENVSGYQSTIVFEVDENAKTYLERELGLQQANHLMAGELSIWYWEVRFFRPQQEEEFRVRVSPAGKIVGYEHVIEEARGAMSLNRDEAQATATQFLQTNLGMDLSHWNFLSQEVNSNTRPNRLDWSFTWERTGFKAKDAPYRLEVGLQGNHIGSTQEFLQVPEAWARDYQHLRSTNILYNEIALIPYGFLLGGAIWLGVALTRQGKTKWGAAVKIGVIVAILYFLMQVNDWNSVRAGYDTHFTYASFVLRNLFNMVMAAIATGLTVSLILPGGEPLYREAQPERLRLARTFSLCGIRSKEFFCGSVVGLSLAAAHIGFIVAFYMVGSRFGVWAPQDLNYSEVVNTSFPWIAGVTIGVLAATSEEFLFRLFAIPFLHKLTGSRVLAVILPAFFWSFLHSSYPQEPGYIRGIEVGIIGIVAGLVMLRWGIVATLIWHYTVDASLVGMLLIRSDNLYFKISGIVVGLAALAPLLVSGARYLARGSFENVEDLLNQAEPADVSFTSTVAAPQTGPSTRRYSPLTMSAIGFLALCVLIGAVAAWRLKRPYIGDYLELSLDGRSATARADAVMRDHGLDPNSYRKSAQLVDTTDPVVNEFLYRRMSIADVNAIYKNRVPGALWRVRYFRDSQPEEYAVTLKPDGSLHGFWHTLAEATKGPNLTKDEATAIAENYLHEKKHIDLLDWKLVEAKSDKHPNRTDHTLTWQKTEPLDGQNSGGKESSDHAYMRMSVQVLGDEPADYRTFIKIPEDFQRHQEEQTVGRILFRVWQICVGLALLIAVLVFFFLRLRAQPPVTVPWRRLFRWGLVAVAAYLVGVAFGSNIPVLLQQYPTSMPLRIFYGSVGVFVLLAAAFQLGVIVVTFGLGWSFASRAFGEEHLPSWLGMPAEYYRDAFWIGLGGSALLIGLRRALDYAAGWWSTPHRGLPATFGQSYDATLPAAGVVGSGISHALMATAILALGAAFLGAELRVRWLRLVLFFAVASTLVFSYGSPADYLKQFLAWVIVTGVAVAGFRGLVRFNVLGLFLIVACTALAAAAAQFLAQPNSFYRANGYGIVCAIVLLLAWPLALGRIGGGASTGATQG